MLKSLLLIVACLLPGLTLIAEEPEPAGSGLIGERPDPRGEATEVSIGVFLIDVDEIDDVNQRFSVDMFAALRWKDKRLAIPEAQRSGKTRIFPLDNIWNPGLLVVNDRGLSNQLQDIAEVDDAGNVVVRRRFYGELVANLVFQDFPFDVQRLPIDIVSYKYSPDELKFALNPEIRANADEFSVDGWRLSLGEPEIGVYAVTGAQNQKPRLTYYIQAERVSSYYLLTMFLPMTLIIFMSWTVFWLQPEIVPSRIAISTASIFSLIAFGFSIRLTLPNVSYMTRADIFVIGSTLMVFLALSVAVIGSRWASGDKKEQAQRLNAVSRWLYIALYFLVVAAALAI